MHKATIDHNTFARMAEAGVLLRPRVQGRRGGWSVTVRFGNDACPLAAQRSGNVRVFRRFETLVQYLARMGIQEFDVDSSEFDPSVEKVTRPDRAEVMRRALRLVQDGSHDPQRRDVQA